MKAKLTCPVGHNVHDVSNFKHKLCPECEAERYAVSAALKEAATNYSAALLMSKATADTVNAAFAVLEAASIKYGKIREGRW